MLCTKIKNRENESKMTPALLTSEVIAFKFRAARLVVLVSNYSERWRVDGAQFSSFACVKVYFLMFVL